MQKNHDGIRRALGRGLIALSGLTLTTLAQAGAHWGYGGEEGPAHWGELDPAYTLCGAGQDQSPIDIHDAIDTDLPAIDFHYGAGGRDEINNGHSIQIDYLPGSFVAYEGRDYALKQFHFHTPSENHVEGHAYPMEAHLVHADADGHLLVIAVLFEEGARNEALDTAWQDMPERPHTHHLLHTRAFAGALLPPDRHYYRFDGSLTTPPCSQGVTWLVMKEPVTASKAQIQHFARVMGHPNNRPVQSLNGRVVQQ
ncbi:MAG: carbonic anhydrase [Thiohalocapsa sp.]|jgi:carbonic anhydrase|uniref:carbonic anhydrase n=1 Tax=Thiohalocapsa sp. TaxID=2497641 RepID=UPI0025EEBBED|nr:carbonic anhydrase [Thiohalocapsa sp.]MCG6940226.1 carbonic anhydrase [Thiohalocapsa sp.]